MTDYTCPECGARFDSEQQLQAHQQGNAPSLPPGINIFITPLPLDALSYEHHRAELIASIPPYLNFDNDPNGEVE